jgi:predicted metallopeptidase
MYPVRSDFYNNDHLVRYINYRKVDNAIKNAVEGLKLDRYGANVVEIYNRDTGITYAVVRITAAGKILVTY